MLFQGDSTTDCERSREDTGDLGPGYPKKVAAYFAEFLPQLGVRFLNRGISGNRVCDLEARWQEDCLDLRPNVVSIMIGINDCWRRYDSSDPTSCASYEATYRGILEKTAATGAKLVMMDPFVLPVTPDRLAWREDLDPKIQAARRLAREFGAVFVPLDGLFAAAATQQPMEFFTADGVHPGDAGHALIAKAWLTAVGAL